MKINDGYANLTDRENTILSQLSRGYANKEIATNLSIAIPTVRTHLSHIYEKMRVRSRTEAIVKFMQHEFLRSKTGIVFNHQN